MSAHARNIGIALCGILVSFAMVPRAPVLAGKASDLSRGGTFYVPVYSHVYHGDKEHPFYVAATLSIRNVDPRHAITVTEIDYHDFKGQLLKKWLEKPVQIGPQAAEEVIIKESDKSGGFGAHFIVRWKAGHEVNPPIMETVMIGSSGQQGISFTSRGIAIRESQP
ncbi:MAG: DUF3124 domain-containing protein [Syntrophobacteraceae bacterium]|jgi:hypothetical protein|nr:DUF3124 domain-containing protein [Syntrophobacteraceae bacterium]